MSSQIVNGFHFLTDRNGDALDDGYVYVGVSGQDPELFPQACFFDDALTIPAIQPLRTIAGYIVNPGAGNSQSDVFTATGFYSLRVKNKQMAQVAYKPASGDGLSLLLLPNGSDLVGFLQSGSGAVTRTAQAKMREIISVKDFGATGDGTTDDTASCQEAIDAVKAAGGGSVYFPSGTYKLNGSVGDDGVVEGIKNTFSGANGFEDRVVLYGDGTSTRLLAGTDNMIIIRNSDCHGGAFDMTLDGGSRPGVWPYAIVPDDMTQTTTVVQQNYNRFRLYIVNSEEGVVYRTGPDVAGEDSGCFYNYGEVFIFNTERAAWFKGCPAGSSGSNANHLVGRAGQGVMNTGVQIDDGSGNRIAMHLEGIQAGTSPNAIPTGVFIKNTGTSGLDNNDNNITLCRYESVTRTVVNENAATERIGGETGSPFSSVFTALPRIWFGGDPSLSPQILPMTLYQAGPMVAGFLEGYYYLRSENGAAIEQAGIWGFKGDEDTGLKRVSAGLGALAGNNTNILFFRSTGVGVGIDPDSFFQVAAPGALGGFRIAIAGTSENYIDGDTTNVRTGAGSQIVAFKSTGTVFNTALITDAADDTAAAAAGVAVGEMYRTGSTLKVRMV